MSYQPLSQPQPRTNRLVSTRGVVASMLIGGLILFALSHADSAAPTSPLDDVGSMGPPKPKPFSKALSQITQFSPATYLSSIRSGAPATCEPCLINPSDPLCRYGIDSVRQSRAYEGSGYRLRRFYEKAMRGEFVTIGILGASVTAGHGIEGHDSWQVRFMEDFQKAYPNSKMYEGTVPGAGSGFFGLCWESLVPRGLDLYIVELDINNDPVPSTLTDDDYMYRSILEQPNKPALMRVSAFALVFPDMVRGRMSTLLTSQYFDVPVISVANFLLPHVMEYPDRIDDFIIQDWRHISYRSHEALGDMLALYMREMKCETQRRLATPPRPIDLQWPQESSLGTIPRLRVNQKFSTDYVVPKINPTCAHVGSKYHDLVPIASETTGNWKIERWNGKASWQSSEVGSKISFPFKGSEVGIFRWTTDGVGNKINPGRVNCWVDNDEANATEIDAFTSWPYAYSGWEKVASGLEYKDHVLTCQISDKSSTSEHDFRLIGVTAQPEIM